MALDIIVLGKEFLSDASMCLVDLAYGNSST